MHSCKKFSRFFSLVALTLTGSIFITTQALADAPLPFDFRIGFDRQLRGRQFIIGRGRVCLSSRISQVHTVQLERFVVAAPVPIGNPVRYPAVRGNDPAYIRCWEGISNGENYNFYFTKSPSTPTASGTGTVNDR
jgi:hypothetical protein